MRDDLAGEVRAALRFANAVAFDGCHKIYIAMDAAQEEWFRGNYPNVVAGSVGEMMRAVSGWWDESCGLRFVQAVNTDPNEDGGASFVRIVEQGAEDEEAWA